MDNFGLPEKLITEIKAVLNRNASVEKAVIFGSRAKGNYKKYSDVDIALFGNIDEDSAQNIHERLEELESPFMFDVLVFEDIQNEELKQHILRCGKIIYGT
jgi:type I restriction enzyme R subunit